MNQKTLSRLPSWLQDLLKRTDEEMVLRGFTRETRRLYLAHMRRFYQHRIAQARLGARAPSLDPVSEGSEVREWLLLLLREGHSHAYTNQALSAIRFLHRRVLMAPAPVADIPRARRKRDR